MEFSELWLGANSICKINSKATKALNNLDNINITSSNSGGSNDCETNNVDSDALDLVSASISSVCTKGAAISLASWAVLPADGTVARISSSARRIAEGTTHF